MKYILIGGSGFIGQHFFKKLKERIILNLDIDSGINDVKYEHCDILRASDLQSVDLSEWSEITVIHLAAVHFDFQRTFYETNVSGTSNVLKFISSQSKVKKYVFFSSVAIYGDSDTGKDESSAQAPNNDYGRSKLEAEKLIGKWHENNRDIQTIIIRPAVVFGEYNFGNVFNLIEQIRSRKFAIVGNGRNVKSIAYAGNIVDSVLFCLENIDEPLFIYNYCDYPQNNILEQSKLISSLLGLRKPFRLPFWITKIITIPIDILERILKTDLRINSMRVKKFTTSTYFLSDKVRSRGFDQKTSIKEGFFKTKSWGESVDKRVLRETWFRKASLK
jgi:nucleoside-diphosphate-sugar epimerase